MPKIVTIEIGATYGRLTVLKEGGHRYTRGGHRKRMIKCKCECGTIKNYDLTSLIHDGTHSCGCYRAERAAQLKYVHGQGKKGHVNPVYRLWNNMLQRCTNPNSAQWKDYGGRGIHVYEDWAKSFVAFYEYVGDRPHKSLTLDRIDNDKGYEPDNVRWASRSIQANNKRPYPALRKSRVEAAKLNKEIKWLITTYGRAV